VTYGLFSPFFNSKSLITKKAKNIGRLHRVLMFLYKNKRVTTKKTGTRPRNMKRHEGAQLTIIIISFFNPIQAGGGHFCPRPKFFVNNSKNNYARAECVSFDKMRV